MWVGMPLYILFSLPMKLYKNIYRALIGSWMWCSVHAMRHRMDYSLAFLWTHIQVFPQLCLQLWLSKPLKKESVLIILNPKVNFLSEDYSSCHHRLVWPIESSLSAVTFKKESRVLLQGEREIGNVTQIPSCKRWDFQNSFVPFSFFLICSFIL